jgi:hypothetical protein
MSATLSRTWSFTGSMLNRLPPESGISESTSSTSAPSAASRIARLLPMKPSPPVIITRRPR